MSCPCFNWAEYFKLCKKKLQCKCGAYICARYDSHEGQCSNERDHHPKCDGTGKHNFSVWGGKKKSSAKKDAKIFLQKLNKLLFSKNNTRIIDSFQADIKNNFKDGYPHELTGLKEHSVIGTDITITIRTRPK